MVAVAVMVFVFFYFMHSSSSKTTKYLLFHDLNGTQDFKT